MEDYQFLAFEKNLEGQTVARFKSRSPDLLSVSTDGADFLEIKVICLDLESCKSRRESLKAAGLPQEETEAALNAWPYL